jgi:hypothetical protein
MIHLSLNIDVTFLLERCFSDELDLAAAHEQFASFSVGPRIEVRMYHDFPMYLAVFYVDGKPILKEELISGSVAAYIENAQTQNFLAEFLFDYAEAKPDDTF